MGFPRQELHLCQLCLSQGLSLPSPDNVGKSWSGVVRGMNKEKKGKEQRKGAIKQASFPGIKQSKGFMFMHPCPSPHDENRLLHQKDKKTRE